MMTAMINLILPEYLRDICHMCVNSFLIRNIQIDLNILRCADCYLIRMKCEFNTSFNHHNFIIINAFARFCICINSDIMDKLTSYLQSSIIFIHQEVIRNKKFEHYLPINLHRCVSIYYRKLLHEYVMYTKYVYTSSLCVCVCVYTVFAV